MLAPPVDAAPTVAPAAVPVAAPPIPAPSIPIEALASAVPDFPLPLPNEFSLPRDLVCEGAAWSAGKPDASN